MLRIGEFSQLSRISIKMLRNYDEIGLLVPEHVEENGYRYYSEHQLPIASRIVSLKHMGFSLTLIKSILKEYRDQDAVISYLKTLVISKREAIEQQKEQLELIEHALQHMQEHPKYSLCDVVLKEIPARLVVSYRTSLSRYDQEKEMWYHVKLELQKQQISYTSPRYDIAIVHTSHKEEGELDIEIQGNVNKKGMDTSDISFFEIPQMYCATLTFKGSYDIIPEVIELLLKWVRENHREQVGSLFNIYHVSPRSEKDPSKFITEICIPIKRN